MRRLGAMVSAGAIVLMAAGAAAQAKPSFAGEWKMVTSGGQGDPGVDLVITQDAATMTVDYRRGQPPAPAKVTYRLDDSARPNAAPPTRARWVGNGLVVTAATGAGEETRTFTLSGGDLVVATSLAPRRGGTTTVTTVTYKRYQRGFGG